LRIALQSKMPSIADLNKHLEADTMPYRSTRIEKHSHAADAPIDTVTLTHDERHLRRKLLHMTNGDVVMLDLKDPVVLEHGDLLATEDGHFIAIAAAPKNCWKSRRATCSTRWNCAGISATATSLRRSTRIVFSSSATT
jgi:hypothetical protein